MGDGGLNPSCTRLRRRTLNGAPYSTYQEIKMSVIIDTTPSEYQHYRVTVAPAILPVTLTEVKTQLRIAVADTTDDTLLTSLITVATEQAEKYTKRDFITRTYEVLRDHFHDLMEIRRSALTSITSITYYDENNALQTLSSGVYSILYDMDFSNVQRNPDQTWPSTYPKRHAVRMIVNCGYGAAASAVPAAIKQAIIQMVINLYENRGDCGTEGGDCGPCSTGIPAIARGLLSMYRISDLNGRPMRGSF